VHEHLVEAGQVELCQVQADELRVRVVGGGLWLAGALEVRSRLWLGGVVSPRRDQRLIRSLLWRVRASGCGKTVLLCTDGFSTIPRKPCVCSGKRYAPEEQGVLHLCCPRG
jgi:hypothetical protein